MIMESYRKINILLIGLTGVGKSSFINSFANYFTYSTFQDAIKANNPICLVPTYFEHTDSTIKAYPVRISANDNENEDFTSAANSSTQSPKIYTFRFMEQNLEINLMDSPGAADTRGITMDKQNIQTILDAVSTFSQLHLICLLLKSTDPRLTPELQFGLNELLMHLHKNAVSNLVFVITNSRASNFSLGLVSAPLKEYLKKLKKTSNIKIELNQSNVFCVDNEAYRLQCLWNQYPQFKDDPAQMSTVEGSWKASSEACKALIKRGLEINAHDVRETVSLNEARSAILLLNDPLTKIYVILQTCVKNYDKNQDAISVGIINNAHRDQDIQIRKIKAPKTICTKCKVICHQNCKLRGIRIKSQADEKLRDCSSFDRENGMCFNCGCHYKIHMRELYEIEKTYRSKNFVDTVDGNETTSANIREKLDHVIEELTKEKKMIEEALEKFGTFLRNNAILEYNFVLENRLELEIRLAEGNGDYKVATQTKEMLEKYKTEKEQLIEAIKSGKKQKEIITSQNIVEIREKLFEMKFYGKKIEELYEIQLKLSQADIIETDRIVYDAILPV